MADTQTHIHMTASRREQQRRDERPALLTGKISLHDTMLTVWEENIVNEIDMKKRVMTPLMNFMKRRGWTIQKNEDIEKNYKCLSPMRRVGSKGELSCSIEVHGRSFAVEIWAEYNCDNSNGGRYCFDKRKRMPYLCGLRSDLEMSYFKAYLARITGYKFENRNHDKENADQKLDRLLKSSCHYKPELGHAAISMESNRRSADGAMLEHGQVVYFRDRKGYMQRGQAFYNLNNMWWVKLNKFNLTNLASFELYTAFPPKCPDRKFVSERNRRCKIESLMTEAIHRMDFKRADLLKNVLFNKQKLFRIWAKDHAAWYRPVSCGYTSEVIAAGLYTESEARNIVNNCSDLKMEPV